MRFSFNARMKSFKNAFSGIAILFRFGHNARIQLMIFIIVIFMGLILKISATGWVAIILVSGFVFVCECFNTAIEYLSDAVTQEQNENIRRAKDVAAAGVLISAIISVIIGIVVFLPEIYELIAT